MDRRRARAVLGVPPGAGEAEIDRAFRRRAHAAHPDRGGSVELFMTLQEARDVLLHSSPPTGRPLTVRRSLWRRVRRRLIRAIPVFLLPRHLRRLRVRDRNLE